MTLRCQRIVPVRSFSGLGNVPAFTYLYMVGRLKRVQFVTSRIVMRTSGADSIPRVISLGPFLFPIRSAGDCLPEGPDAPTRSAT